MAAGYDPDQADWPGYVEITAPTPAAVSAVMRELGYTNLKNRDARIIVGSTVQSMMRRRPHQGEGALAAPQEVSNDDER